MTGDIFRVLQDTRNAENHRRCEYCGACVDVVVSEFSANYEVFMYKCGQCGAVSSLILEVCKCE